MFSSRAAGCKLAAPEFYQPSATRTRSPKERAKPSPHYKFETTPGGQLMLSAPNNSERSLLSFQPYAQRALAIAQEHRLRIRPHSVQGSRFKMLYDLIVIFP